ncbi:hypothetical protein [Bradyrhizobium sp. 187]|uniref:hypothetical protein n=1 Tax=Bradyrhizobium sp. 187 TaxID=2782655 RepID=UPI001FFF784F|nr:hypothetical protein [Bradyrhizobium sp. 187]UPJ69869.1 hypothetical protein IVB19_19210 [Bradyrhizobium sp. 187]
MTPANDDQPIAADRVVETRPSPDELNRILHRRFPGMGPAHGWQLEAAARKTFNADLTQWFGLDGRWHSTAEQYRQPRGKRRQPKENVTLALHLDEAEAATKAERDGWMFTEAVACRWREYAPAIAEGALDIVGKVVPATTGSRLMQFGAVEDAMIRAIDAKRLLAANDNVLTEIRRNRPRLRQTA